MKIKKYLPIIGIVIFLYILFKLNISNVLKEISHANFFFILLASCFILFSWITTTLKWFIIAKRQKIDVPFYYAFKINLISIFYGFITPSRIGSIIRIDYLKKFNKNRLGKGISNYILEKFLDIGSLFFLVLISSFVLKKILSINYFHYALFGLVIFLVFFLIFRDRETSKKMLRIFYVKFVPEKIKNRFRESFYSFYEDMPEKRYFVLFFFFSIINWIVLYSILYFIGLAIGINISFFYFLLFMPIVTIIGQIPITINGLGTKEAAMISLFGLLGVSATKIFSMSLINLVLNGIIPAIIGMLLTLKYRRISN